MKRKLNKKSILTSFAYLFLVIVGISAYLAIIPPIVFPYYLLLSLVTFVTYAIDKSAAKRGAWRVQENTLHLLALAGGWPGAIIAQQKFRHKSSKTSFRIVLWVTILLNISVLISWHTASGAVALRTLINSI